MTKLVKIGPAVQKLSRSMQRDPIYLYCREFREIVGIYCRINPYKIPYNFATIKRFSRKQHFFKKASVLCFSRNLPLTSYQISENSSEWFLRYAVTNGRTNEPEFIDPPVFNRRPKTQLVYLMSVTNYCTPPFHCVCYNEGISR